MTIIEKKQQFWYASSIEEILSPQYATNNPYNLYLAVSDNEWSLKPRDKTEECETSIVLFSCEEDTGRAGVDIGCHFEL